MKKLYYLANLRLPTDKAHSIQIMKMCEALVSQGIDLELVVPNKQNNIGEEGIFAYYSIKTPFKIRTICSTDFLGKTRRLGKILYWIDLLTFLYCLNCSSFERGSIVYSRDPKLLFPFNKRNYRRVVEIHSLPARRGFFLKLLRPVSRIVVVTKHLKEMLMKEAFPNETIMVASDAVDIEAFDINLSKREARERLGFPQDKTLIGYAGMLKTMGMGKGIDTALSSLKGLSSEIELVLIGGDQKDIDSYKELAKELGVRERINFTGRVPYNSIPLHLGACDILIAPFPETEHYKYYMSPLKLFEYMASSRPIVVSDLPSIREVVDESMVTFCLPGKAEDLGRAIKEVLNNPEAASRRVEKTLRIVEDYSWQKRAERILDFIYAI